jgi:hypothetical protein
VEHPVEPVAGGGAGARERHHVDLGPKHAALLEERVDGETRVARVVFEAGEALFGGAAHDAAVAKDGRRRAVGFIEAEDDHLRSIIRSTPSPCPLPQWGRGKSWSCRADLSAAC